MKIFRKLFVGAIAWLLPLVALAALTRTDFTVDVSGQGLGTSSYTTGSFTMPANALAVVRVNVFSIVSSGLPASITIADSRGLTWTSRIVNGSNWWGSTIFTAPDASGGSFTVTVDAGANDVDQYVVELFALTGYDTSSPIGATAQGSGTDGAVTITLSGAPASTSQVLGFLDYAMDGSTLVATPGAGFTEIHDQAAANVQSAIQSQVRTGSTSTSVPWVDVWGGNGSVGNALLSAIEIKAATVTALPEYYYRRRRH